MKKLTWKQAMTQALSTPRFEDAVDLTPMPDGRNWRVDQAFHYDTDIDLKNPIRPMPAQLAITAGQWRIEVPTGFVTDLASVPRLFWNILPPFGVYTRAAVIHDLLYRTPGLCTRAQADAVLMEAMTFLKVGWFTRHTIYAGVRAGGHFSYKGEL